VALDSDPACVLEISKGSADAWVYDQISVMNYALANPDTTKALLAPIRIEEWAVGLKHGEAQLRDRLALSSPSSGRKEALTEVADGCQRRSVTT